MAISTLPSIEHYAHGVRARYVAGCRCAECRAATARYERERKLRPRNPLVPASAARVHLAQLSAQGVGRRAVAAATDIPESTLGYVNNGTRPHLRLVTEQKILAVSVDAISDGALVDASETWRLLRALIKEGHTKRSIARAMGSEARAPKLQVRNSKVTAAMALRVKRLYAQLQAEDSESSVPAPHEYERPRYRILRSLRFFDWVESEDLFTALELDEQERANYAQMISRLAKEGCVERRGQRPFEYRSKQ